MSKKCALSWEDENLLLQYGYEREDFAQIERTFSRLEIEDEQGRRIGKEAAMKMLGRGAFLANVGRAAFHGSSADDVNGELIYFWKIRSAKS